MYLKQVLKLSSYLGNVVLVDLIRIDSTYMYRLSKFLVIVSHVDKMLEYQITYMYIITILSKCVNL